MRRLLVLASLLVGIFMVAAIAFESVSVTEDVFSTGITIDVPAGDDGDMLIASVVMRDNRTITPPEGWTVVSEGACGEDDDEDSEDENRYTCRLGVWSRVAEDEPESYRFTWQSREDDSSDDSSDGDSEDGFERAAGAILRYSGVIIRETATVVGEDKRPTPASLSGFVLYIVGVDNDVLRGYPDELTGRFAIEADGSGGDVGLIAADGVDAVALHDHPKRPGAPLHFHLSSSTGWRVVSIAFDEVPTKAVDAGIINHAPEAFIGSPNFYAVFQTDELIRFSGLGIDPEDGGLIGASLVWTSNINGPIGIGESFETTLSPGVHTVRLEVTDTTGLSTDTFRQFTVVD